jgi:hypothetical protein
MGPLCAPNAHPTVSNSKKEQKENRGISDLCFALGKLKNGNIAEPNPNTHMRPIETKEELIERLSEEFSPAVVQDSLLHYEQHLKDTGQCWKNGRFVEFVTVVYQKKRKASA